MITAKNIFTLEREEIQELVNLAYRAGLNGQEWEAFNSDLEQMTEGKYDYWLKTLPGRDLNPLDRIKNGELTLMSDLNKACKTAVNRQV